MPTAPAPFLTSAALLIWGWWMGALPIALILALLVEVSPRVAWRWEISDREFDRVVDFSAALLVALTAYIWFTTPDNRSFLIVVGWLPLLLFPLFIAQLYSSHGSIDLSSLFLSIRRIRRRTPELFIPRRVRMDAAFIIVCLVAAASTNQDPVPFFALVTGMAAWSMFPTRSRRYPPWVWVLTLAVAVGLGGVGQVSLTALQGWAEEAMMAWIQGRIRGRFDDPARQSTAIGQIGNLKLSHRVDWLLRPLGDAPPPELLRRAAFQTYLGGSWNGPKEMARVTPAAQENAWPVGPLEGAAGTHFRLTGELWRGQGMIPLPANASRIERLPAQRVESNTLGAVLASGAPDFLALDIQWGQGGERMAGPAPEDLVVPVVLAPSFERVSQELGLAGLGPREAMQRIETFFSERFAYSLTLPDISGGVPPLTRFLLETRSGHCEYFASAGVILARAAGVPARYASGYAVMEQDGVGGDYILRARHSHAWTLAWVDGRWQDWDFTPAGWVDEEAASAGILDAITTRFSLALLAFREYRLLTEDASVDLVLLWFAVPLLLFIGWRIYHKPRRTQAVTAQLGAVAEAMPTTAFQPALDRLEALGLHPEEGETLQGWLQRLHGTPGLSVDIAPLLPALAVHYRARFHPDGAGRHETEEMQEAVTKWLRSAGSAYSMAPSKR